MTGHFEVVWEDAGRAPQVRPNPAYPDGIDIDVSNGAMLTCSIPLRYPAPRVGAYVVACTLCGLRVAVTTAGRPDDPRSLTVACKRMPAA